MGDGKSIRRVALIGTGKMGSAIAGRLAKDGFELTLWNRTRDRAEKLGIGRVTATPLEAVSGAEIAVSSLTGPAAIRAAYFGPEGALAAGSESHDGRLFVEMSTAGPDVVVEIGQAATAAGHRLVDAPILGAPTVVQDGKATVLLGGSNADVARAAEVVGHIGATRHVGPLGSAARLKLVANSMMADCVAAAAELQVAGEQAGLDPADVFFVIERLVPMLSARRRGFIENWHDPNLFALRDLLKDLNFATEMFGQVGSQTPITANVRDQLDALAGEVGGLDITALAIGFRKTRETISR